MSSNSPPRLPMRELNIDAFRNTTDRIIIETLIETEAYLQCKDYREQCHILHNSLSVCGWSSNKISTLLDIDHKSFERQINSPILPNPNGRPPSLNEKEKTILFSAIEQYHKCNVFPTLYDLQQFIISNIQKVVSVQTIHNYLIFSKKFKIIEGKPMQDKRCFLDENELNNYFEQLKIAVNGTPVSLVFNMDEAGEDEYADSFSMMAIVPKSYDKKIIPLPVRRQSKRSTLLHCICADGTYLKPLVIIPRKTIDSVTFKRLNCNNLLIKHQEKGFANTEIIKIWLGQIFFLNIQKKHFFILKKYGDYYHPLFKFYSFDNFSLVVRSHNLQVSGEISSANKTLPSLSFPNSILKSIRRMFCFLKNSISNSLIFLV